MRIYIAGPFFTDREKENINTLISKVKAKFPEAELFIPMEHFVPGGNDKDENGNYLMPNDVWGEEVFKMDLEGLNSCDMLVAYYDGHYSDTGTAWEIGYAYARGIPTFVWIPDQVSFVSCMVVNGCTEASNRKIEQK